MGAISRSSSWGATPRAVLADAGLTVDTYDEILVEGRPVAAEGELPALAASEAELAAATYDRGFAWDASARTPLQVRVYRAVPITVQEGALPYVVDTTAQTVGEALRQAEVILYLGDRVQPSLGQRVTANMHVFIQRSIPVSVLVDGRQLKTRTQAKTVGDALSELGVVVAGQDRVEPRLESELYDNVKIRVTRVGEDVEIEEEIAPFETVFVADPNLAIDTQEVLAPGANGITRTRYRVRYENGDEVARVREDRWVAQEPAERRIAYGQGIQPQTATMPDGSVITYWRKVQMLATSYSPAAAGRQPHPHGRRSCARASWRWTRASSRCVRRSTSPATGLAMRWTQAAGSAPGASTWPTTTPTFSRCGGGSTSICCGRRRPTATLPGCSPTIRRCRNNQYPAMTNATPRDVPRRVALPLLLLILLAGLALRMWNINFDRGIGSHPDERSTACFYAVGLRLPASWDEFRDPRRSPLNPLWDVAQQQRRSFTYGHFPLYLGTAVAHGLHALEPIARAANLPEDATALMARADSACDAIAVGGRLTIALLDTLTILLLYLLGCRFAGRGGGLLAAGVLCVHGAGDPVEPLLCHGPGQHDIRRRWRSWAG